MLAFVREMGLGLLLGLAGGFAIVRLVNRLELESGLYPIVVLAAALVLFGVAGVLHCSGFLAVYVAGLIAGNRRLRQALTLRRFQDGMTWLAQIGMFVVFGLLATPSEFPRIAGAGHRGRPVPHLRGAAGAIWLCLAPFRFHREETDLHRLGRPARRGVAAPRHPADDSRGLPLGQQIFNAAFIIVLVSLFIQGWTIRPMARQLGLIIPPTLGPVDKVELELPGTAQHELVVYHVVPDSPVARGERIPRWARPSLVAARGQFHAPAIRRPPGAERPRLSVHRAAQHQAARPAVRQPGVVEEDDKDFFGEFYIDPRHTLGELATAYGVVPPGDAATQIGDFMREKLGGHVEIGDRLPVQFIELIVRDTGEDGTVSAGGLALAPEPPPPGPSAWPVVGMFTDFAAVVRNGGGGRGGFCCRPADAVRAAAHAALGEPLPASPSPVARHAVRGLLPCEGVRKNWKSACQAANDISAQ